MELSFGQAPNCCMNAMCDLGYRNDRSKEASEPSLACSLPTKAWASAIIASFWLWTGIAYQWLFFGEINRAAYVFGALFLAQGLCLAIVGVLQGRLSFGFGQSRKQWVGAALIAYATVA
jgi:Family of unknown function (DUF6064)